MLKLKRVPTHCGENTAYTVIDPEVYTGEGRIGRVSRRQDGPPKMPWTAYSYYGRTIGYYPTRARAVAQVYEEAAFRL